MFKLKCDDFLIYDEATGTYSMSPEQQVRDETERNRWKNTGWSIFKDWRLYIMLIPMLFVYFFWKYMPMYELMGCFKNPTNLDTLPVADQKWVGLQYFFELFTGANSWKFWMSFRNTFATAFYGLLFGFPMPIILALFFNEVKSNIARSVMQVCVYLPKFLSTVIVTSLALILFRGSMGGIQSIGIVSTVFGWFGANKELLDQGLVTTSQYYRAIYIITDLWEHAGYDSIVFFAAVIAVSPTSYEAAQIDGAGKMAQMRYVVIPSILSTVVIMLIMKIGSLLSVGYEKIYLLLVDGDRSSSYEVANTVSTLANEWSSPETRIEGGRALGTAAEMLNNLIGMILVIGANKIARKASNVSLY
ncbi:MAG: sugar ABC transporter permease [Clostridia bacterium]|nr:sugar ABC transporter permease [Clostridia bacterium]